MGVSACVGFLPSDLSVLVMVSYGKVYLNSNHHISFYLMESMDTFSLVFLSKLDTFLQILSLISKSVY